MPRRRKLELSSLRVAAVIAGLGCMTASAAVADEDIPTFKVLTCESKCPTIQFAVPVEKVQPDYPSQDRGFLDVYTEAQVDVRFTIGTDGAVKNAEIERLVGPPEFGESALAAVNRYKYRPATEDGHPVEENHRIRFSFQISNPTPGGREKVVAAYRNAIQLAKDGKIDDAIAALKAVIGQQRLNFYERTMVANALATMYVDQKNFALALDQIRDATLNEGGIPRPARAGARDPAAHHP